jgi:hypothetical protein
LFTRIIITAAFIAMLYCLGSGLFYLSRRDEGLPLAKSLTWRIVIAVALFGFLFLAYNMGWMQPHGLSSTSAS